MHDVGTGAARGLAVLVSKIGNRSYRCVFYYRGSSKPYWMNLGRVGEMSLEEARDATRRARRMAKPLDAEMQPQDPREAKPTASGTFVIFPVFDLPKQHKLQRTVALATGIEDFFFHGVRHLVEMKMAELRDEQDRSVILPHLRDLLLDHAPARGAGKGYDHHNYKAEMRTAMEAWSGYVERLVQPAEGVARLR